MNSFNYQLKTSNRIKRLTLNISANKGLEVTAPVNTPKPVIEKFLIEHHRWIQKHQHLIDAFEKPFVLPQTIKLQALEKCWEIIYTNACIKQSSIQVFPEKILISKRHTTKKHFQAAIKYFLKQTAMQYLSLHLTQLSELHQLPFRQLTFRVQKTRWGSCSPKHHITLNAALLFLPIKTVHYVMIHELCHTKYLNHSKRFWHMVESLMPDYNQHRKILKQTSKHLPSWL